MPIKKKQSNELPVAPAFEVENKIEPLKLMITIIDYGQADVIAKLLEEADINCNIISSGIGSIGNVLPGIISLADEKKQIVYSFIREDKIKKAFRILEDKFKEMKSHQGISFTIKLTSVAGVSMYRFLSNLRKVKKA